MHQFPNTGFCRNFICIIGFGNIGDITDISVLIQLKWMNSQLQKLLCKYIDEGELTVGNIRAEKELFPRKTACFELSFCTIGSQSKWTLEPASPLDKNTEGTLFSFVKEIMKWLDLVFSWYETTSTFISSEQMGHPGFNDAESYNTKKLTRGTYLLRFRRVKAQEKNKNR